jgi:hypothetical protein
MSLRRLSPPVTLSLSLACIALAGLVPGQGGCAAVTNTTAIQCTSEAECLALGPEFANSTCDGVKKVCVRGVESIGTCTKNQECLDQANGLPAICRRSDRKCVTLTTPECPLVFTKAGNSELADDNVVIIGSILPGLEIELGTVFERAGELAHFEISNNPEFRGLPPVPGSTAARRPLAMIQCREIGFGLDGPRRMAKHLATDVQVPLVIGPIGPTNIASTSQIFQPARVMSILPLAYSSALDELAGNPIAPTPFKWRIGPDDRAGAAVSSEFIRRQLEPHLNGKGVSTIKVAIVATSDLFGRSASAELLKVLKFNKNGDGSPKTAAQNQAEGNLRLFNFGDFEDIVGNPNPQGQIGASLGGVFLFKPNIILHAYTPAAISRIVFPIEGGWDTVTGGAPRPFQIGSPVFTGFGPLFPFFSAQPDGASRLFALQVFSNPNGKAPPFSPASPAVLGFQQRFRDRNPDLAESASVLAQTTWTIYDAVYTAAYAITALRDKPLTGENIANVLSALRPPAIPINTYDGPTGDLAKAYTELGAGRPVDLNGLSGPMDFDLKTGAPFANLEITCAKTSPSGAVTGMKGSGFHFSAKDGNAFIIAPDGSSTGVPEGPLNGCPPLPP